MEASDIISAVDMAEYISQYCDLTEKSDELWGLSPFKEEKTPSFSVDPGKGYWYDFSSGTGGNLVDFVMRYHHCSVAQAVRRLAAYAGISDDGETRSERLAASRVAKKYKNRTKPDKPARIPPLPSDIMDNYEFRRDKLALWHDEGISWEALERFSVRYDALDNRIVYPVRDYDGNIISVCGRTCDPDYKEKKLRKYTYFQSLGSLNTICCFADNREDIIARREIILFEGVKSVMKAWDWGYTNGGALLTSHLSDGQMKFLIRLASFHAVRPVFALDAEVNAAADDNVRRLMRYASVEWIHDTEYLLEEKEAPVDRGREVFERLYAGRKPVR